MSQDEIIAMAKEANPENDLNSMLKFLLRFAALVAAKEREAGGLGWWAASWGGKFSGTYTQLGFSLAAEAGAKPVGAHHAQQREDGGDDLGA